jgi:signal transduction histidine kinase
MRRFMARLTHSLLDASGWFTIAVVAIISFVSIDEPASQWLAVGLCLAFAGLEIFWEGPLRLRYIHVYFAVQTALVVALFTLKPNAFAAPILFFILSAQVMVGLPLNLAALWIIVFTLATAVFSVASFGLIGGLFTTLPYIAGYSFFGAFGKATRDADLARHESQRLLAELQTAQGQLQQLAVAEERNRMARELHDSLGHRLIVAVVQLEGAQRLVTKDPERAANMIGAMREQMKAALGDLRRAVATLRTPLADDAALAGPLGPALARLADEFHESTGLLVHLSLPPELPPLDEAQRLTVYRAAQESLTNTHKHAGAKNIWLNVSAGDEHLTLIAADDGRGLSTNPNGGFGLRGLRERVAQVGGELELGARPGGGAQVSLTVPLNKM